MLDLSVYTKTFQALDPVPVWLWIIPEEEGYPCVVYAPVNDLPGHDHDGITTYRRAKYQIDCFSEDPTEVRKLGAKVVSTWAFFKGEVEGVQIGRAKVEANEPTEELARDGRVFRQRLSLLVEYEAS